MAIPATLQQLGRNRMMQAIQPVRQLMNTVRFAQNPQAALSQLMQNNPQLQQVMQFVRMAGQDPTTMLNTIAAQNGTSVEELIREAME